MSSAPSPRLADRLADAEATALVGRTVEREALVGLLTAEPGPAIVFLHGPGGIGKSILLHGVLDRLGAASVRIDGRHVEPTPTGLLEAIAAVLGVAGLSSVQDAAAVLKPPALGCWRSTATSTWESSTAGCETISCPRCLPRCAP